jgi:hypothetical protein
MSDEYREIARMMMSKAIQNIESDLLARSFSTASNVQPKPLTEADIMAALDLVKPYDPPFNEIWCNTASIKQAIEDTGGAWKKGLPPVESFQGIPVELHENMPNMLMLVKRTGNPFETPKIYGIVNIEVKE